MIPERLWTASRFVPWEDTIRFHVRLFRCFLPGFLHAHGELAFLSQGTGPEWIWAVLGRRLAGVGLVRYVDAGVGRLHEPDSYRARCPPKRRYEVTWLPPFSTNAPVPVPPFVSQPINITHGLHDTFDIPGSGRVLGGYDDILTAGVVGCILLWLFTMAIVVSRSSSVARTRYDCARTVCRAATVAVDGMSNSGERVIRPDPRDCLATDEAIHSLVTDTPEVVDRQAFMPGAWFHECREQSTLEESVLDRMSWTLFHSCAQMGIKAWAHVSGLTTVIAASDPLIRGSSVVTIERKSEDDRFPVCQGLGLNALDLDTGAPTTALLNETEQSGVAPDRLPSECSSSPENLGESTMAKHNRRCDPSAVGDVAIRDLDAVSSNADREDMSLDGDESASEDGSDGVFGPGTRRADISPLDRKDAYRVLGRRQDGALSDAGCPFSLRRARSTGYLSNTRDVFADDDEGTGDDFYWTEQVNARLSGERPAPGRPDGCSWPREDESDNWRTRSSQVFAAREETSEALQCQVDSNSTKLRRYSSPPLNADASLSDRAGRYVYASQKLTTCSDLTSGDGPPGIYVVPQKRGRTLSPVSSPRSSDRPTGLGFFPFRKTPSLLTPEAWRPGCLYLSDPPVDESREADAWWDSLARGAGSTATGIVIQEQGPLLSREVEEGPVSWRDRYENNPASRRFISVHRRTMTEG